MNNAAMIRQAQQSDRTAIVACAKAAYQHYIDRIGKPPAPMVADFATLIAENKVDVLIREEQLLGYVVSFARNLVPTPITQSSGNDAAYFLENIAVDPQWQGAGHGKRLVSHVEALARDNGCTAIELYTNALMVENISWYSKLGFMETVRRHEDGFDRVYMRLELLG